MKQEARSKKHEAETQVPSYRMKTSEYLRAVSAQFSLAYPKARRHALQSIRIIKSLSMALDIGTDL